MQHKSREIRDYLTHGDDSLAVRRLLDYSLEMAEDSLLRQAIVISREYNQRIEDGRHESANFFLSEHAIPLLEQLERIEVKADQKPKQLLKAEAIAKRYKGSNFSLFPISLDLFSNDILGIVGENGNGKTTLLRSLAGQLALDSGSIEYPNLKNPDFYAIKNHVAFIPQRIPRWYGLLKDNLHYSASLSGLFGTRNELMVDFMLERLNLSRYSSLTWSRISSGYRTRFELARILLFKPGLLILDEPLANLDIKAQQTVLTDLRFLAKSNYHPLGIILSSQQLHEVEKVADTVLFIKQGKCLYRTGDSHIKSSGETVVEIETHAHRDQLSVCFSETDVVIQFNGGFYTLESRKLHTNQILFTLLNAGISIHYFRDITHSTKRYFN